MSKSSFVLSSRGRTLGKEWTKSQPKSGSKCGRGGVAAEGCSSTRMMMGAPSVATGQRRGGGGGGGGSRSRSRSRSSGSWRKAGGWCRPRAAAARERERARPRQPCRKPRFPRWRETLPSCWRSSATGPAQHVGASAQQTSRMVQSCASISKQMLLP